MIPDCISLIALAESGQAITALNGIYCTQLFIIFYKKLDSCLQIWWDSALLF